MNMLFSLGVEPEDLPDIPGLSYRPNSITEQEESALAAAIDAEPWDVSWERRRQPYGASYGKSGSPSPPIPTWGRQLADRIKNEGLTQQAFDQMLVNEYLPGQGIALHRDYEPFDRTVASLSLLAPCVMQFHHVASGRRAELLLERRSLIVLTDEARYDWEHGIARRKNDVWQGVKLPRSRRVSITFRSLRRSA